MYAENFMRWEVENRSGGEDVQLISVAFVRASCLVCERNQVATDCVSSGVAGLLAEHVRG